MLFMALLLQSALATAAAEGTKEKEEEEEDIKFVGLTIWTLPGRGFAVGRFYDGRRATEREFPLIFTDMDGGFNAAGGALRMVSRCRVEEELERAVSLLALFGWVG